MTDMQRLLNELDELRKENCRLRNENGDVRAQLNAVLKENQKLKENAERDRRLHMEEQETLWPGR